LRRLSALRLSLIALLGFLKLKTTNVFDVDLTQALIVGSPLGRLKSWVARRVKLENIVE
jgi:hypothetical protein